MDIPMCMRTFRVPASSVCSRILRRTSAQDHVPGTERLKLVNEVSKDQAAAARKCAHGTNQICGVCHESRSLVHMIVGTWCLPLSVTCSRNCIDPTRPSVLVKFSCGLCRLVFSCSVQRLKYCVRGHDQLQAAWIKCSHPVAPTCSGVFRVDCLARVQQTRFYF